MKSATQWSDEMLDIIISEDRHEASITNLIKDIQADAQKSGTIVGLKLAVLYSRDSSGSALVQQIQSKIDALES